MTFLIHYTIHWNEASGRKSKTGTMKAKKAMSSIQAQVELEKHFKRTYPGFIRLEVSSCTDEGEDIMDMFGGIFGDIFSPRKK